MSDLKALESRRGTEPFADWDDFVPAGMADAGTAAVRDLVAGLIALGPTPDEAAAREAVSACVRRFNELDDGWIDTTVREDIAEALWKLIELAGFEADEDWIEDRDW